MQRTFFALLTLAPTIAMAAEYRIAPGDDVQAAVDEAMPGDVIILEEGTHTAAVRTARDGRADAPITLRGQNGTILTAPGRVVDVQHAHIRIEDLVVDAGFADSRVLRIDDGAVGFTLTRSEVRNARRHCIDIRNTSDVVIEDSLIHHCLAWDGGRSDAHGISAQAVQGLTIRGTEIHTFTGDAFQIDPSRSTPGWSDVLIEGCTFWLAPVTDGAGGVPDGVVPGENAIDTKTVDDVTGDLAVRDTTAYGFRNGEIGNMAAFNIKENVDAVFDAVTVFDSEIAFRLRGASGAGTVGVTVSITNAVVYDVDTALRLESDLPQTIPVHHATFGADVSRHVALADGALAAILDPQNVVVLGAIPDELAGDTTVSAEVLDFQGGDDYRPVAEAPWLDTGIDLGVDHDRRGAPRPQGAAPDPGAFEYGEAAAEDTDVPAGGEMRVDGSADTALPNGGADAAANADAGLDGGVPGNTAGETGCSCSSAGKPDVPAWLLFLLVVCVRGRTGRSEFTDFTEAGRDSPR